MKKSTDPEEITPAMWCILAAAICFTLALLAPLIVGWLQH